MAEKINIGDTYYRVIDVTAVDEDGEKIPYDLTDFTDNYVAIKTDRGLPDEDAFIFKRIPFYGESSEGKLLVHFSPYETAILPSMEKGEVDSLMMFVQIGSNISGRIHEVSAMKVKTRGGGIQYKTDVDRSFDMGLLSETIGWQFDGGELCEPVTRKIDFGMIPMDILFNGGILSDTDIIIVDAGLLSEKVDLIMDAGFLKGCSL